MAIDDPLTGVIAKGSSTRNHVWDMAFNLDD